MSPNRINQKCLVKSVEPWEKKKVCIIACNYKPIICLTLMWKILLEQVAEKIYNLFQNQPRFSTQGAEWLEKKKVLVLLIPRRLRKKKKKKKRKKKGKTKNLAIPWIDYKTSYNIIFQAVDIVISKHTKNFRTQNQIHC